MAKIIIPTPLRKFTESQSTIEVGGATVKDAVHDLTDRHPGLKQYLLEENGSLKGFVKIFVGDEDINSLNREETGIETNSTISIIPAIAGGSY